jgi:hypothetical protein
MSIWRKHRKITGMSPCHLASMARKISTSKNVTLLICHSLFIAEP